MGLLGRLFKRLVCSHDMVRTRTIHGDEANFARSEWHCQKCGKRKFGQYLDRIR